MRNSKFLLFLIAMPIGYYLLFANLHVGGKHTQGNSPVQVMVAICAYAATAAAMYATGPELSIERSTGWLRQLFTTPLSFTAWMAAKLLQALALTVPVTATVCLTAVLANGVHLDARRWLVLLAVMMASAVPFAFLGHIVGLLLSNQSASAGQVLVLFGLSFLGGVFVPIAALPHVVRAVSQYTPTYHLVALGDAVTTGHIFPIGHLAALGATAAVTAALAALLWRRDGATGT